ncbi:MAG TPA: nickel insertion protein, partial [Myxococcales bacterium]|nr:nickel insertion protein [Myxococcales bacterium]
LELLRGRTLRPSGVGERTTPTGAALLAAWTESAESLPELAIGAIGYGAGTKRWDDAPNVLRAVLGERVAGQPGGGAGWVVEANLDDLSPQLVAAALEAVLAAGAADAWIAPVTMKKGRPGHLLGAVVPDGRRAAVEEALFRETSTLGVRAHRVERSVLQREMIEVTTSYGPVRVKVGRRGEQVLNAAPEFEDCRRIAQERGVAVKEVVAAALAAWRTRFDASS